ncbi:MAG: hypothetical protein JXP34_09930 [Planctomycetes bacterium]|nr:hypothetical protein [Planctomycetota bacterium]
MKSIALLLSLMVFFFALAGASLADPYLDPHVLEIEISGGTGSNTLWAKGLDTSESYIIVADHHTGDPDAFVGGTTKVLENGETWDPYFWDADATEEPLTVMADDAAVGDKFALLLYTDVDQHGTFDATDQLEDGARADCVAP